MFWLLACHTVSFSFFWMVLWDLCACHTLSLFSRLFKLFSKCFLKFESVWDFWRAYLTPMLQIASKWTCWNFLGIFSPRPKKDLLVPVYLIICWVDFLRLFEVFLDFCLYVTMDPGKNLNLYDLTGGLTRLLVAQLNNSWVSSGRDSEIWLASMYQARMLGSLSWARISWETRLKYSEGLWIWVGIHAL